MTGSAGPGKLRNLSFYMAKALKFYDLKNETLSRSIFLVILVINFLGIFVPESVNLDIFLNLVRVTVINLASAVYLAAYIKDLKGEACETRECLRITGKNAFKILAASISYIVTVIATFGIYLSVEAIAVAVSILGIPLLIIFLMFILNVCYVVDKGKSVAESYGASRRITYGYKKAIFFIILIFNVVLAIPLSFLMIVGMITSNELVFAFVFSFATTIVNIMQNRLTALLYMDLEYGRESREEYSYKDYHWHYGNRDNGRWYEDGHDSGQYGEKENGLQNEGVERNRNEDNNRQFDNEYIDNEDSKSMNEKEGSDGQNDYKDSD